MTRFLNVKTVKYTSSIQFFFLGLFFCVLSSCASSDKLTHGISTNSYLDFYEKSSPEFQKLLAKSPFHLLRGSNSVFLSNLSDPKSPRGLFAAIPPTVIHGDFHVQQMALMNSEYQIDDFDTADWGPFWIDLLRMEMSGLVIAHAQSLKLHNAGACVNTYLEELSGKKISIAENPIIPRKPNTQSTFSEKKLPKDWKKAGDSAPDSLIQALSTYLKTNASASTVDEMKALKGGVGSFESPKYLAKLEPLNFVELKFQEAQPLKQFTGSPESGKLSACDRFKLGAQSFASANPQAAKLDCLTADGNHWAVIFWSAQHEGVDTDDFNSENKLAEHMSWMCKRLASAHMKNWKTSSAMVAKQFEMNPLLREKILLQAREEFNKLNDAFRLILAQQKETK